jgi:glycosyltransferase involved in cell wall biosynthesis
MRPIVFLVPGSLDAPTGGYAYDRHVVEGLRRLGWPVEIGQLDGSFPSPTPSALSHAAALLGAAPDDGLVLVDGLALGAMPALIEHEAGRLRLVGLVHLPLAADIGIPRDVAVRREAEERRAITAVARIIVTGKATLALLDRYLVAPDKIVVVEPGTAHAALARGSCSSIVQMLCVATLQPGKGHEDLLNALAALPHTDWHLTCAGSLTRDAATAERVRNLARDLQLENRVTFLGELDTATLDRCYDRADLFVLATRQETYGMAIAEALARGLPIVSTTTGAIPTLVGADAGLLTPPGDTRALAESLSRAIGDARLRASLAGGARRARGRLRSWDQASREMAHALERVETDG